MRPARPSRRTPDRTVFFPAALAALLSAGIAMAAPETLIVQTPENETLYVHFDYDRSPEIAAPEGWGSWEAMELDSFFVTDSGTPEEAPHLRYRHAFYAELDGRKAAGTDYIFYDFIKGDEPHYTSEIGFRFPKGDTVESWTSTTGPHMVDDRRLVYYERGIHDGYDFDFMIDRIAGGVVLPSPEKGLIFLGRRSGWVGKGGATSLARGAGAAAPVRGGWVTWGRGSTLTVPERATRLLLFDAKGRAAWKAEALKPGARLQSPAGLWPGAFQCLWLP